jgi:hypothetical protein
MRILLLALLGLFLTGSVARAYHHPYPYHHPYHHEYDHPYHYDGHHGHLDHLGVR